ncbi:MAG: type II secretion system secretin GspD [Pseudomonadota bacterium]|nr:type II secretion system secretin GspD [Pseudomonadota bacterium]MDP1906260.1 type II secretion system secretin GspD [Pseudomonadota bacterium]MDP2353806.1 type II secretion system secretin GspD [Pseudomonadota bacterium]
MLNFVNAEIESVVRAMGLITGKNFLLDPRVKGTINISSVKPVSADLAYQILISSLRMQGFTAVEGKGVVKILPEADAKQHFSQTYVKTVKSSGDQVVTQVYPLQHATAAQLVSILRPLVAPNNAVSAYPGSNTLVITDYADNLKRISEIIEAIDRPNEAEFNIIKVKHLSAIELSQQLSRLFAEPTGAPAQAGGTSLLIAADARSNSLLVRTDNQGKLETLRAMVAQLDTPSAGMSNLQVVHLRNADATKLAETLRAMAAGEARAATGSVPGAAPAAASGTGSSGVTILADAATNSLVINAPDHLYNSLRAVIDKLDAQRAQVFVEALIVEVTSQKAAELGIQWQGPLIQRQGEYALVGGTNFSTGGNNLLALSAAAASGTALLPGAGLNLALGQVLKINGKEVTSLTALARLLESDSDANILSTPNLLMLDNEEAKIVIGQNVPFLTGSYAQSGTGGTTGATVNPFQTIERKDVGLTLKVKPQVSEGGNIKLQIVQEVSNVSDATNQAGIITNKRAIETTVLVGDGESVVLGGLIQDDVSNGVDKVPGLGGIPLIGSLFRSESRKRTKTNLMVFLRPVVVRTRETMSGLTDSRYDYIRNIYGAYPAPKRWLMPDISPEKLPDLKLDTVLAAQPKAGRKPEAPKPAPAPAFSFWPE